LLFRVESSIVMAHCVIVGASNMDLVSYVPRLPVVGETLHGSKFSTGFGGKGSNQAIMVRKLGVPVSFVTKLGRDAFGTQFLDYFRQLNMDTTHIGVVDGVSTGVAPISVDKDGRNSIIIVNGANDHLLPSDIIPVLSTIRNAQCVVVQLEVKVETSLAALRAAREAGVVTILNPAPARADLPPELLALADIICPNEPETSMLTGGLPVDTPEALQAAASALLKRGCGSVVLTLGARGAALAVGDSFTLVPPTRVPPRVVDTTGAGDCFVGTMAACLAAALHAFKSPDETPAAAFRRLLGTPEGRSRIQRCMERANLAAGMSVEKEGTSQSFPTAADLPKSFLDTAQPL